MLRIRKRAAPRGLVDFARTPGADWDGAPKEEARRLLVDGQLGRCAYCTRRIGREPTTTRIDHWSPRSLGGSHFDWDNLLASCHTEGPLRHCDAHKEDATLLLHPARDDVEARTRVNHQPTPNTAR
jgi:uncharacterized protein (TIGR02646 family)